MVQYIQAAPSFGDKLREALVGATGSVAEGIQNRRARTQLQKLFETPQQEAQTGQGVQNGTQGQPQQPPMSVFQQVMSQQGGPAPQKVFALSDAVAKVYGEPGRKFVLDMAASQNKLSGKEEIQKRTEERAEVRGKAAKEEEKATKYLDEATKSQQELLGQKTSLDLAEQAVNAGTSSGLTSGDFWATQLGAPELRSTEGAVLDASAKTHLLTAMGNLSGGRPNQFIEKQIAQAFALPGGRKEGNLAKLQILKTLASMKQSILDEGNKIATEHESKGEPVPGNIERMALKDAMPKIEKIQKISSYKIQDLMEPARGSPELEKVDKVPKGTPLTEKKAEVLFKKANPGVSIESATQEQIDRAVKLARGLGYDDTIFDLIAEAQ